MNAFVNAIANQEARTENGMKARKDTKNAVVDLFYKIGASRGKNIVPDFSAAFVENPELAIRVALWARDARGGAGRRIGVRVRGGGEGAGARAWWWCATASTNRTCGRTGGSDGVLGLGHHRGLALAHGDAGQGRCGQRAAQSRRPPSGRRVGSGQGRGRRPAVQGLRRARDPAAPHARAHLVAGRSDAQARDRQWRADAPLSVHQERRAGRGRGVHQSVQADPV